MAVPYQRPTFRNSGGQKEPSRVSLPVGTGAQFLEADFVTISTAGNPPVVNATILQPPTAFSLQSAATGGTVPAGTYFVATSYLNGNGETTASTLVETVVTAGATSTLSVAGVQPSGDATGYRVYVGTIPGTLHLQGATTAIGTAFTTTTYSAGGAAPQATNGTGLAAPAAPTTGASTAGSLPARTEFYKTTYVNGAGETIASGETSQVLTAGQVATVTSPAQVGDATGYNVYAAATTGAEVKQNAAPIAIGTNFTEPVTGLVSQGVQRAVTNQPPTINGLPAILGLADHDYNAIYGGPVGGASSVGAITDPFGRPAFNQSVFGITEQYPGIATEPANAHVLAAAVNQFDVSLVQAWDPGMLYQACGLTIDPASNLFVADLSVSNKIATITRTVDGPGFGGVGDTGKRISIQFIPAATAPGV